MIEIKDKKNCCGCWACANACPKHCIMMVEDNEGFRYPQVNSSFCINCGLCEKVCPVINVKQQEVKKQRAFLLQNKKDLVRHECASGGAFSAIASWVIKQEGVVFGVSFKDGFSGVQHTYAEKEEDLAKFRNSKYVQSEVGDAYSQVRHFLKEDRWVLFSGTPCQIEGLVSFLRGPYAKLVLVDIVCYGVPSPGFFRNYISWQRNRLGGKFTKFFFREKRLCYNYTSVSIYNEDEEQNYHVGVERDKYMRSFFSNRNIRPSCYDCKFKKLHRISDFTIWDCYDVRRFSRNFDENGTNRVLVHTEKGMKILDGIRNHVRLEEHADVDFFIKDEFALTHSVTMPEDRRKFFDDYSTMPFDVFLEKWFPDTFSVWINSFLRMTAFKMGVYNRAKYLVKKILRKN